MKSRFIYVILTIILVILVNPFIRHTGKIGYFFATILITMIPLASYHALTEERNRAIIILLIAAPFVILDGINMFFINRYLMVVAYSFGTILYFYIIVLMVIYLLSCRVITANLIYCAISAYFLIGIMWAGIYTVLEGISPGSISGISETPDLIYFSFVTLTTVGFGDVTPQSILCQRFAVVEAAIGGIYLTFIIAMIVGRYISMQVEQSS